ncbi:MAG TPA: class I SAM-dependent methyltransferase [Burkholderiales bacterium]|nr:class I SAM-dependent methyltransferase [Burkholderiales bacterium]
MFEDKRHHDDRERRLQHGPRRSRDGLLVADGEIAPGQDEEELAVMPQIPPVAPINSTGLDPDVEAAALGGPLLRYARTGHRHVGGWLLQPAVDALLGVIGEQGRERLTGAVCEIGVHHGRLFILLCLATRGGERAVAYDLFARQLENSDQSGRGDLEKFLANAREHGCDADRIQAITINSRDLDVEQVLRDCVTRPRLFSIDGGHAADQTCHDLETACAVLCRGGVIILDDLFNEAWPGVAEGTCRFMLTRPHDLVPFAIVGNKVFLTNDARCAAKYRASVTRASGHYFTKVSALFGHEVLVVLDEGSAARRLRRRVAHHWPFVRVIAARLRRLLRA